MAASKVALDALTHPTEETLAAAKSRMDGIADLAFLLGDKAAEWSLLSIYMDEAVRIRDERLKQFGRDLPRMIASSRVTSENIIVKTPEGLVATDESPFPIATDLREFYRRRRVALENAPPGPWVREEATLLAKALLRTDVGNGAHLEGDLLQIPEELRRVGSEAMERFAKDPLIRAPLAAFRA